MKRYLLFTNLALAYLISALSIWPQTRYVQGAALPDMDDETLLERYQIPATREGWLTALQNPVSAVRSYGAFKLADGGFADAAPPILAALEKETVPGSAISLALAAASLGAEDGFKALTRMCQAGNWDPGLRMSAARAMSYVHRADCLPSVINVLRFPVDDQSTVLALNVVPLFEHLTADQMEEVKILLSASSENRSSIVRSEAYYALHQIGGIWATSRLRSALAVEPEESLVDTITSYLKYPKPADSK